MKQAPTDEAIHAEELEALRAQVAALEVEREAEHQAMTASVRRIQDRAEWARGLSLPAASHLDGCPMRPERIESFDGDRRARVVRCQDCGAQEVFFPTTESRPVRRLEA